MTGKKKPYGITNIVSWGATVVIIGLLFKIQHWPYGGVFISAGLVTEAALFFLLGFQREAEEAHIDWTRVYPELSEEFKGELPTATVRGGIGGSSSTAALDKML
ncbi:MAG TPA: gliding motility protein GldL, partial [Mucilaginibacter sp.]|nr:gliding motility protein GldL [Mucilaginibacter sp.]